MSTDVTSKRKFVPAPLESASKLIRNNNALICAETATETALTSIKKLKSLISAVQCTLSDVNEDDIEQAVSVTERSHSALKDVLAIAREIKEDLQHQTVLTGTCFLTIRGTETLCHLLKATTLSDELALTVCDYAIGVSEKETRVKKS